MSTSMLIFLEISSQRRNLQIKLRLISIFELFLALFWLSVNPLLYYTNLNNKPVYSCCGPQGQY